MTALALPQPVELMAFDNIFMNTCKRQGIENGNILLIDLHHHYQNPLRWYHNWCHVRDVFERVAYLYQEGLNTEVPDTLVFSAAYHDIVYVPGSKRNESDSSAYAYNMLRPNSASLSFAATVIRQILGTTHKARVWQQEVEVLCDADLYGLASEPEVYDNNTAAIRDEYYMFSDDLWIAGRKLFLKDMLEKDQIFHLDVDSEEKAKENLSRELEAL